MRKNWFITLIIVAGTAVLIATILRFLTPKSQPLPASPYVTINLDGSKTAFGKVTFTGTAPEFPRELSIAQVQTSDSDLATKLIADYGLVPNKNSALFWQGEEYALYYNEEATQYSFLVTSEPEASETDRVEVSAARTVAQEFISTYFPKTQLQILESDIKYFADERQVSEPQQATHVQFPFTYQVDNFPIKVSSVNINPLVITINHDLKILRASFFPQAHTLQTVDKKPLISVTKAIENLNLDHGAVISVFQKDSQEVDMTSLQVVTLNSATLEYRIDEILHIAYPFYHFFGTAVDAEGVSFEIEVVTPAVASTPQ